MLSRAQIPLLDDNRLAARMGYQIALWRVARGLTEEDLAQQAGVTPDDIQALERGTGTLRTLAAVTRCLEIVHEVLDVLRPRARTLDELERVELALGALRET